MRRLFPIPIIALSLAISPAPAVANDFVEGFVGGIIGGAIVNSARPKTQTRTVYRTAPSVSSATREQTRQVQTSLNYFGFNAGGADGVMGRNTRSAISGYQAHMGYPVTGRLTEFERSFLINAYYRAQAGGPTTSQLIASNPQGVRGLLIVYRDEQMNGTTGGSTSIAGHYGLPKEVADSVNEIAKSSDPSAEQLVQRHGFVQLADINGDGSTDYILDTSVTGSAFWCSAQACAVRVFASTPNGYERNDFQAFNVTPAMFTCTRGTCNKTGGPQMVTTAPGVIQPAPQSPQGNTQMVSTPVPSAVPAAKAPETQMAAAPSVPNFFGSAAQQRSLASHCNMINLVTSTNGGFMTAETMTDANAALGEQMCLTRSLAIARGDEMLASLQGVTASQVDAQCAGFGGVLKEHVTAAGLKDRADVLRGVSGFVVSAGMSPQQLESTALVCLASGYRTDDMDVAIGSALLLTALGQAPYGELLGHHLSQGFGTSVRPDLAAAWYDQSMTAIASGTTPVFAPSHTERLDLLRKAVATLPGAMQQSSAQPTGGAVLPTFVASE